MLTVLCLLSFSFEVICQSDTPDVPQKMELQMAAKAQSFADMIDSKMSLTSDQKEKIYDIQMTYLNMLFQPRKFEETASMPKLYVRRHLKEKRRSEILEVFTSQQRAALNNN